MSQYDMVITGTSSGSDLATALPLWEAAMNSCHAGSTRPSYAVAKTLWVNDATNPWVLYMFDGTDDIQLGTINATTNKFIANDESVARLAGASFTGLVNFAASTSIASSTTLDLTSVSGNTIIVTGTVATTSFTMSTGQQLTLVASAAWPLTYNSTNMNISGGESVVCATGDRITVFKALDGVVYVKLTRQSGVIDAVAGTVSSPSFARNGDGVYFPADNEVSIATNNLNSLWVKNGDVSIGGLAPTNSYNFEVRKSSSGASVSSAVINTDSTNASSSAQHIIYVNGASVGDPTSLYSIGGVSSWVVGADNSDSDNFKISSGTALGTNDAIVANSSLSVFFPNIGTTASAANAYLNNASTPANALLRSTSSLRYKEDIIDVTEDEANLLNYLRPITYKSKAPVDDKNKRWYGFIAEEVNDVEPKLVQFSKDENEHEIPDGVQYERLTVLLVAKIKKLEERISILENK